MDYAGMTVNERLYVSGKMDKFDKAVSQKNVKEVVKILKSVDLQTESIIPILESLNLEKDNLEL
jgi:ABC-type sugar transport system ATPase subunit